MTKYDYVFIGFSTTRCSFVTDTGGTILRCLAGEGIQLVRLQKTYFVYIMTNRSKTLYTGVTNNLVRRVREHKMGTGSGFAVKYQVNRLVYFERFEDVHNALEREKQIKGWLRMKKIALIVSVNPAWRDLSLEWYERHQFQPQSTSASS
jgi:putative endonuclease